MFTVLYPVWEELYMGRIIIENIDIFVEKKPIKNMYIRIIPPDGKVKITAPLFKTDEAVRLFAVSKINWIKRRRKRLAEKPRPAVYLYEDGETHVLLGKQYPLKVMHGRINTAFFRDGEIILQIRNNTTTAQRAKVINEWYREVLQKIIPSILEKWEKSIGVRVTEWKIQNMKTKWGTCNISERRIVFNLKLAKKPPECLEYVIIHELLHLLEKSHGAKFKKYMNAYCPDWRAVRKILNR